MAAWISGHARATTCALGLIVSAAAVGGCGAGTDQGAGSSGVGSVAAQSNATTSNATTDAPDAEPGELTRLARQASEDLARHARVADRTPPDADPAAWVVSLDVDLALTDADLDDPVGALPAPFDRLAPGLVSMVIRADSPTGSLGYRLDRPFTGLRAELDGSNQVVTTRPGDDPPSTSTWPVGQPRIERLTLTVTDFDALADGPEIVDTVGAERLHLGLPGGWTAISVAEARAGTAATMPPLTGTRPPMPSTEESEATDDTPDTTGPDDPDG